MLQWSQPSVRMLLQHQAERSRGFLFAGGGPNKRLHPTIAPTTLAGEGDVR